jgi:hypothetical protein
MIPHNAILEIQAPHSEDVLFDLRTRSTDLAQNRQTASYLRGKQRNLPSQAKEISQATFEQHFLEIKDNFFISREETMYVTIIV